MIKIIPTVQSEILEDFEYETIPSKTYKLNVESNTISGGYIDTIEAIKQTIYCILNTERFEHLIYSWNYGSEIKNLIGEDMTYVIPELQRIITEALLQDDRIDEVSDFDFEVYKNKVLAKFKVKTIEGIIEAERVINV